MSTCKSLKNNGKSPNANTLTIFDKKTLMYNPTALNNLKGKHKFLVNATLETDGYSAKCAVLNKVRTHSAFGHYSYEPTIVVGPIRSRKNIGWRYSLSAMFWSWCKKNDLFLAASLDWTESHIA